MPRGIESLIPTTVPSAPVVSALDEVREELRRSRATHDPMHGPHEGYAVILEELDELWDEVREKKPDVAKVRKEAIQVAAMAVRFVEDVCDGRGPEAKANAALERTYDSLLPIPPGAVMEHFSCKCGGGFEGPVHPSVRDRVWRAFAHVHSVRAECCPRDENEEGAP